MTTETQSINVDNEKQRNATAISGGIFLIGLGVLMATGWWWPGIMVTIGLSGGASLILRGKTWQGVVNLLFFCGIAAAVEIAHRTDVDGAVMVALILVGAGVITLLKGFFFRD